MHSMIACHQVVELHPEPLIIHAARSSADRFKPATVPTMIV